MPPNNTKPTPRRRPEGLDSEGAGPRCAELSRGSERRRVPPVQSSTDAQIVVGQRYRLLQQIGADEFVETWAAFDARLDRVVALRLLTMDSNAFLSPNLTWTIRRVRSSTTCRGKCATQLAVVQDPPGGQEVSNCPAGWRVLGSGVSGVSKFSSDELSRTYAAVVRKRTCVVSAPSAEPGPDQVGCTSAGRSAHGRLAVRIPAPAANQHRTHGADRLGITQVMHVLLARATRQPSASATSHSTIPTVRPPCTRWLVARRRLCQTSHSKLILISRVVKLWSTASVLAYAKPIE